MLCDPPSRIFMVCVCARECIFVCVHGGWGGGAVLSTLVWVQQVLLCAGYVRVKVMRAMHKAVCCVSAASP